MAVNTKFLKQSVSTDSGTAIFDLEKNILIQCGFSNITDYIYRNTSLGIKAEIYGNGISFYLNDSDTILNESKGDNSFIINKDNNVYGYYAYSSGNYLLLSNLNDGLQCGIIKVNEDMLFCIDTTKTSPVWTWDRDNDRRVAEPGYFFDKTKIDTLSLDSDISWYKDSAAFAYLVPLKIRYGEYTENLNNLLFTRKCGRTVNDILYIGYYIGHISRGILEFNLKNNNYICFDKISNSGPVHYALTMRLK